MTPSPKPHLSELGLTPDNAIVIGSGILNALGIRASADIDLVVDKTSYQRLSADGRFKKAKNHGKEILADDLFEIGTSWTVLGKDWRFPDFLDQSIVIDSVRYTTLQFLLDVKKSWLLDKDVRQKDRDDVRLIEEYLAK